MDSIKTRAPRNRTLSCSKMEMEQLRTDLIHLSEPVTLDVIRNSIIHQDFETSSLFLPKHFIDLLIIDPPYNLTKDYNGNTFYKQEEKLYTQWFENMISKLVPSLKQGSSIYVCSDWKTSTIISPVLSNFFFVRNRITWEREKGRGAKSNWKNNTEDIWFCTQSDDYLFNVEDVKLKRKVLAPYRDEVGKAKDWDETENGNFRLTYPSNIWSDITIPFWSMPENTDHPTQKPEKLIAKLVLASSKPNDIVFDPFLGSGTTAVVAKKLGRQFSGIEINEEYCCLALKRLKAAEVDKDIQGYSQGVFWERNSLEMQKSSFSATDHSKTATLF